MPLCNFLVIAEIADKMPVIGDVWQLALAISAIVAIVALMLSAAHALLGALFVVLVTAYGCQFCWGDPSFDHAIQSELGNAYLLQQRFALMLPSAFALAAWYAVQRSRRMLAQPAPPAMIDA